MYVTWLSEMDCQLYSSLLMKMTTEFKQDIKRKKDEAIYSLSKRFTASPIQVAATKWEYDIKSIIGLENLKFAAIQELARLRGRPITLQEAEELCKDVQTILIEYEKQMITHLENNSIFIGRGRGARLRIQNIMTEQRNNIATNIRIFLCSIKVNNTLELKDNAEIFVDDISNFTHVKEISRSMELDNLKILKEIPEHDIKHVFAQIICEPFVDKDWGGEKSDLFTSNVLINNQRISTAFLLKGPAKFRELQVKDLGKNGDQIIRLYYEPADLMILQHCHKVSQSVRDMMRTYAEREGNRKIFCIIDGFDTLRILHAYHKFGL